MLAGGLVLGTAATADAQTNIDQGKSPAEMFAGVCATCHKSPRGLANGRGSLALASFLQEHYTATRDQASALAAYVLGAGGNDRAAPQPRGTKPERAAVEEPKPPAGRVSRERGKPEEAAPASVKPRAVEEEAKPGNTPGSTSNRRLGRREAEPNPGSQVPQPEAAPATQPSLVVTTPPAPAPAPVVVTRPTPPPHPATEPPSTPGPTAAGSANSGTDETEPVPRDNIPD